MPVEQHSLDAWLAADLHRRFGELEQVPEHWMELLETVHLGD